MKKILSFFITIIVLISCSFNTYVASAADINTFKNAETQKVVSYDSKTGVETYEEISSNSSYCNNLLNNTSDTVLTNPEVSVDSRDSSNADIDKIFDDNLASSSASSSSLKSIYKGDGSGDERWRVDSPSNYGKFRNTCSLRIKMPDGTTYIGTGFVLSNTAIVTAGHCVYDYDYKQWAKSIQIMPAYENGYKPYGSVTGTSFSCGLAWKENGDAQQDWGVIHVNNNFPSECGYLGLRYQSSSYVDSFVYVSGYPGKVGDNLQTAVNGNYMYCDYDKITWNSSSVVSYTKLDTSGGQSGAPVIKYYSDNGYTAIAIHRGVYNGKNSGVRLSEWLYNYLVAYRK